MLAIFYGSDRTGSRDKVTDFFADQEAEPGAVRHVDGSEYAAGQLLDMIGVQSLFGGREYFLLDTPSSNSEFLEDVTRNLAEIASSPNVFVVLEESLLAADRKKYEKYTDVMVESTATSPERFNVFAIAEALAKKDKKQMWVLLQQVRALGIRDEETIGILWWQLKALRLASVTSTAEEADMKEYPYKKAKGALRNFKEGEVDQLAQSLLELYHDGHKGISDMDVKLEQWVLTV